MVYNCSIRMLMTCNLQEQSAAQRVVDMYST